MVPWVCLLSVFMAYPGHNELFVVCPKVSWYDKETLQTTTVYREEEPQHIGSHKT